MLPAVMDRHEDKLEVVLECLALDNPRSHRDYIDNMMTWELEALIKYRDSRKRQLDALPKSPFKPRP